MNYFLPFLLITMALLSGCAKEELSPSESAKADYLHAKELINNRNYSSANLFLEKFSTKHPYSQHIAQAELLRIFASFKNSEYILSETLAIRFLSRHPNHSDISYAQYMLAMSYLKQTVAFMRDPAPTEKAMKAFKTIIEKYPNSSYVQESTLHLQNLRNKLALHELYIGKYYFDHQRYVAANNRFQVVLKKYQTSPAIEEALYYLSASYAALKLTDSARDAAILLRHNYPKSQWSEKAAAFL